MKSFVVMTYYQLMHSVALALTFDEKPNLYFSMAYLDPEEEFLDRIRQTGVFNAVVGITRRGEFRDFLRELEKTDGLDDEAINEIGSSLFDKYLLDHYDPFFEDADFDDDIYIYNDFQWHYYYISKRFSSIIAVEDGYRSILQQTRVHRYKGDHVRLEPFIRLGHHPEPLYRNPAIKKIISSEYFDELDDYYKSKLEIWDFNDIVALNKDRFRDTLLYIFRLDDFSMKENSVLYLEQPLDRAKYCNSMQSYLLNRKYLNNEVRDGRHVYMKPHPAERLDCRIFESNVIEVMPNDFPVEILNYQDGMFEKLITFGSTGTMTTTCAKKGQMYYTGSNEIPDVKKFIRSEIRHEKLVIDIYIRVNGMTPADYINVYSTIFRNLYTRTRIYIICSPEDADAFEEYFDKSNLETRIKEFKKANKKSKKRALWHSELRWMKNWAKRYETTIDICPVSDPEDDWCVFKEVIYGRHDYDYMILLEKNNNGFVLTESILKELKFRMKPAISFQRHTIVRKLNRGNRKISLSPGYVNNSFEGVLTNVLWHRALIDRIDESSANEAGFADILVDFSKTITRKFSISLYDSPQRYLGKEEGSEYYAARIRRVLDKDIDPDEAAGAIANLAYDYYNWRQVAEKPDSPSVDELLEEYVPDDRMKLGIYMELSNGLLHEKNRSDNNVLVQQGDFYYSVKHDVDQSAKSGALNRASDIRKLKQKVFKKK